MLDIQSVDWDNLQVAKSGRTIKLLYDKEPLSVCTSSLYSPFGIKSVNKEWSNFTEYSIDCSMNQSSNENSTGFRTFIEELDTKLNELVQSNLHVFDKNASSAEYSPFLRENKNYPKLMKLQLPRDKNGNFQSFIFDNNKDKIKISDNNIEEVVSKGKVFKCIIECAKLWYYNGKIGSIWNVVQLKFNEAKVHDEQSAPAVYNELMIDD